ncbi:Non-fluorescent flavoprotein [Bienertia sinuspersici]
MYSIERYLQELKLDARNKGRPEASMAEGFLPKECAIFVARYMTQPKKRKGHLDRDIQANITQQFFPKLGYPIKGRGRTSKKKHVELMIDHITLCQAY